MYINKKTKYKTIGNKQRLSKSTNFFQLVELS